MAVISTPTDLPRDLFDVYASYKMGTGRIIRWLSRIVNSTDSGPGVERSYLHSVNELRYFADCIILGDVDVPDELLRIYRRTLQARKRLTGFYKGLLDAHSEERESTERHSYFNSIFEQVLHDLERVRGRKRRLSELLPTHPPQAVGGRVWRDGNPYGCLAATVELPQEAPRKSREDRHLESLSVQPYSLDSASAAATTGSSEPAIAGDALGDLTNLYTHLLELDHLASLVRQTYRDAAAGSVPLIVAAATTTAAYEAGNVLGARLEKCQICNPAQFKKRFETCMQAISTQPITLTDIGASTAPSYLGLTKSMGPQIEWEVLCEFRAELKRRRPANVGDSCEASRCLCEDCGKPTVQFPVEDPIQVLALQKNYQTCESQEGDGRPPNGDEQNAVTRRSLILLLQGMERTVAHSAPPAAKDRWPGAPPLVREFVSFLGCCDEPDCPDQPSTWGLCFGLHLLLESYKAYCGTDALAAAGGGEPQALISTTATKRMSLAARQPRLQSLHFAAALRTHVGRTMQGRNAPCKCLTVSGQSVLAQALGLDARLGSFVATKRFDLFTQAPWVSGQHDLEHLAQAAKSGARVWHYGYYVGTVLHLYNALVSAGLLAAGAVPVLEVLCSVFESAVFLGKRSTRSLLSCWRFWTGTKIRHVNAMHKEDKSALLVPGGGGKFHLCQVPDASQGGDRGSRSFSPAKVSLFSLLSETGSVFDDRVMTWVYLSKEKRIKYQPKDVVKARKALDLDGGKPLAAHVAQVQAKLLDEFGHTVVSSSDPCAMPLARLNYFAVYEASMQTMRRISVANHDKDPGYICNCTAEVCLRDCEVILQSRLMRSGRRWRQGTAVCALDRVEPTAACVACIKELMAVFGKKTTHDFVWSV